MGKKYSETFLLGVKINKVRKHDVLNEIKTLIETNSSQETKKKNEYIVTPYSEYFVAAQEDKYFQQVLNDSYLSLADGIFPVWASYFQNKCKEIKSFRKIKILWTFVYSGAYIVFQPGELTSVIKERIPGSILIYDLCRTAAENGYKVAILGGLDFGNGNTGVLAAEKLEELYPSLDIVEIYPGERAEEKEGREVVEILEKSKANILFCCYGAGREEKWLYENLAKTGIDVGIGLGGSLDYVSGVKKLPPEFIRKIGLEWFFRPFFADGFSLTTFKTRLFRAWPAMIKSSWLMLREELTRKDK
jgi:N-acetylglucosaminyldiphosphoundecaprenol N-acetyl-beta-D-mannosaminyltransferase